MPAKGPQSRSWVFVINNPHPDRLGDDPQQWFNDGHVSYIAYQLERAPTTGTIHWQGYVWWTRKKTLHGCKEISPRANFRVMRGTHEQARDYSTKEDTRLRRGTRFWPDPGPYRFGDEPRPGERTDLLIVKHAIDDGSTWYNLWQNHFAAMIKYCKNFRQYRDDTMPPRTWQTYVAVLYGPTGTGKSRFLFEHVPLDKAYWVNRARGTGDPWMDGYDPIQHEHIVIDEFHGWIHWDSIKRMLDRYPCRLEGKGYCTNFRPRYIWFTSNKPPQDWYNFDTPEDWETFDRRLHYIVQYRKNLPPLVIKDNLE